MTTTPPGWYDDGDGRQRWWDGERWSEPASTAENDAVHAAAPEDVGDRGATVVADPRNGKRSKRWIVWVAIGGSVVVAALLAGALTLPTLLGGVAGAGDAAGAEVADAEYDGVVAAVERYEESWQESDCEAFQASTTPAFREQAGLADCSAFETAVEKFAAANEDYTVAITGVRGEDGKIVVTTTESFVSIVGQGGEQLDEPVADSVQWTYVLVPHRDEWVIEDIE